MCPGTMTGHLGLFQGSLWMLLCVSGFCALVFLQKDLRWFEWIAPVWCMKRRNTESRAAAQTSVPGKGTEAWGQLLAPLTPAPPKLQWPSEAQRGFGGREGVSWQYLVTCHLDVHDLRAVLPRHSPQWTFTALFT